RPRPGQPWSERLYQRRPGSGRPGGFGAVASIRPGVSEERGPAVKQPIRLRGISGEIKGRVWEAGEVLRAGRLNSLEIVLDDNSVSRKHAELRLNEQGWCVRDLESTNGTYVNGV